MQLRVDGSEAVFSQHSGAERCGAGAVETRDGRFVVYVASDSHAAYFHPGVRDRMWPDPNDEARGDGAVVTPRVEPLGSWVRRWARPCTFRRCDEVGECDARAGRCAP
jgi:hypothetical protein